MLFDQSAFAVNYRIRSSTPVLRSLQGFAGVTMVADSLVISDDLEFLYCCSGDLVNVSLRLVGLPSSLKDNNSVLTGKYKRR